jgi:membrane-associated protease RseP (regulator of RpoE activity)
LSNTGEEKDLIEANYEVIAQKRVSKNKPDAKTITKHLVLFVLTFISVSVVSSIFVGFGNGTTLIGPLMLPSPTDLLRGVLFASLLLSFLTFHEFGHYFAAVYHKIKVSLPYYIPLPLGIGTLGAVIRIKEKIHQTKKLFDVGIAGPIAGFIVSLIVLLIGFATLPEPSFVENFSGHEELKAYVAQTGEFPTEVLSEDEGSVIIFGNTLLYGFLSSFFDNVPPLWEMYHYPWLLAGWFGLFFTALNLMPVGQLDGGHILYSLIGYNKHKIAARIFYSFITILAGIELVPFFHDLLGKYDTSFGALSWLIWAIMLFSVMQIAFQKESKWVSTMFTTSLICSALYIYIIQGPTEGQPSLIWGVWTLFITFVVKVEHPPVTFYTPLSNGRKVIGWISMLIFILCISLNPIFTL